MGDPGKADIRHIGRLKGQQTHGNHGTRHQDRPRQPPPRQDRPQGCADQAQPRNVEEGVLGAQVHQMRANHAPDFPAQNFGAVQGEHAPRGIPENLDKGHHKRQTNRQPDRRQKSCIAQSLLSSLHGTS